MMLEIAISAFAVILSSNNAFAQIQTLHNQTLYEVVKQTSGQDENPHINVGADPQKIYGPVNGKIYVANFGSDTVSVISAENNTKIGDIRAGDGRKYIAFHENIVYVANEDSGIVSVFSAENNTKIREDIDMRVRHCPTDMVSGSYGRLYVANLCYNYISVITTMPDNTTRVENITVGDGPSDIDVYVDIRLNTDTLYVAHISSNYISVITIMPDNTTRVENITVGDGPSNITFRPVFNTVYVYVATNDYISVITIMPDNTTRVESITVGDLPGEIVLGHNDTIYVTSYNISWPYDGIVSKITIMPDNTTRVENITVGGSISEIDSEAIEDTVFVAYRDSDTVSKITTMPDNTTRVENITVGDGPSDIAIDSSTDTIYVANSLSGTVSVIDGIANKVVAGVTFQINPFNSGVILCDRLTTPSPIGQYIYVYSGTQCTAKPNPGFEFVSWEENLDANSTQPIQVSPPASSWDSFVLAVIDFFGPKPDKPEATLKITKFGTFTANFKEAPPPLPQEFWVQMYAVIGTVVTALFMPSIVGWFKSKRDIKKLNYFHRQIATLNEEGKLDENHIRKLDGLRGEIADAYSKGKLNEKHYESLRNEISMLYEEIFRRKITALDSSNNNYSVVKKPIQQQLAQIRNEIKYAYSKGKINDKHHDLLNNDISDLESKKG